MREGMTKLVRVEVAHRTSCNYLSAQSNIEDNTPNSLRRESEAHRLVERRAVKANEDRETLPLLWLERRVRGASLIQRLFPGFKILLKLLTNPGVQIDVPKLLSLRSHVREPAPILTDLARGEHANFIGAKSSREQDVDQRLIPDGGEAVLGGAVNVLRRGAKKFNLFRSETLRAARLKHRGLRLARGGLRDGITLGVRR